MPFWELYKQREVMAEFQLSNELGEAELTEKINTVLPIEKVYFLLIFVLTPHILTKIIASDLASQFFVFIRDLKDENYQAWLHKSKLPAVKKFSLSLFDNQPYLEESPQNYYQIKQDVDLLHLYIYFLIHFYQKIEVKITLKSYYHEILEINSESDKMGHQGLLEKMKNISDKYIQDLGL